MTSSEQDKINDKVGNDSNHDAFDASESPCSGGVVEPQAP